RRSVKTTQHDSDEAKRHLIKLIRCEVILVVGVLAVTSVLTHTIPAKTSLSQPVSRQLRVSEGYIELTLDPAKAGPADFHVYVLDSRGVPLALTGKVNTLDDSIISVTI